MNITNCLNANEEELKRNGYRVIKGNEVKDYKLNLLGKLISLTNIIGVTAL